MPLQLLKCWCVLGCWCLLSRVCAPTWYLPYLTFRTLGLEGAAVREGSQEPRLSHRTPLHHSVAGQTPLATLDKQAGLHVPPHKTPEHEGTTITYLYLCQ